MIMPKKSGAVQENLSQSSNGSWRERGGVREHRRKSGAAGLSHIFNNILLERKMRHLFVFFFCKSFYLCGFLPAAQLVVDSVVGPGHYIVN